MTTDDGTGRLRHAGWGVSTCLSPWYNPGETLTVGEHKKCECDRCDPMRRRSSDKRYVAYSVTLKRDEKTLMNRHVMNDKQHNTTTIPRPNNDEAV